MFTYLLINDSSNEVVHTHKPSLPGFRHFGKYENCKQISCFTGKVISTVEDDLEILTKICNLRLTK